MDKELNLKRHRNYMILGSVFNSTFSLEGIKRLKEDNIFSGLYTYGDEGLKKISADIRACVDGIESIEETERRLRVDFNRYFVLFLDKNSAVPLWASYYLDKQGTIFGENTIKVKNFYLRNGYKVNSEIKEPEDHLTYEFGFMVKIIEELMETDDLKEKERLLKVQESFLNHHLKVWLNMLEESQAFGKMEYLYKHLLDFTVKFVNEDQDNLRKMIDGGSYEGI